MKIVITGGHHTSALPVIKILQTDYSDVEIVWFGHKYSAAGDKNPTLEYREIRRWVYPFTTFMPENFIKRTIWLGSLKSPLAWRNVFSS